MKFFTWAKGIFEDQTGYASSKRVVLFWAMAVLTSITFKGWDTPQDKMNMDIYFSMLGVVLAGLGMVTSEYFKKVPTITTDINNK